MPGSPSRVRHHQLAIAASCLVLALAAPACRSSLGGFSVDEDRLPVSADALFDTNYVVIWFDEYDAVFSGTLRSATSLGGSLVDVLDEDAGVRCVGRTQPLRVPPEARPPDNCEGMRGSLSLSCSDGRDLEAEWRADAACNGGYGQGTDGVGRSFRLVAGGSQQRSSATAADARRELKGRPPLPPPDSEVARTTSPGVSSGTAFFVSWGGHLVTNHHVIGEFENVQVQLGPDETFDAQVVARDVENDLAILRVEAIREPLPVIAPTAIVRGERVFTLGYPLIQFQGQEQKATFGRINALSGPQGDVRFAQIDVPIQPGNSGGPLINRRGEVVGVVSSMLHPMKTLETVGVVPQNVNYALKSDIAAAMLQREIGDEGRLEGSGTEERPLVELVGELQDSVVLVLAW